MVKIALLSAVVALSGSVLGFNSNRIGEKQVDRREPIEESASDLNARSGSFSPSKRGMAYNSASLANTFGSKCAKCGWAYNWDSTSYGLNSKYSFVPMLWSDAADHTNQWNTNVNNEIAKGAKAILSFNEPDNAGQARMTPEYAAKAHAKWMNPFAGRVLIGAPAVTNSGSVNEGLDWLKKFFTACNAQAGGCKVDFCPIHWYSDAQWASTLLTQLASAHTICGNRPIWLTEFAPTGGDKVSFLNSYLPQLDKLSYLEAYSYFMVATGNLMTDSNNLSNFGNVYATK